MFILFCKWVHPVKLLHLDHLSNGLNALDSDSDTVRTSSWTL